MKPVVLAAMNGGLGDSLIMSTLPELWARERGQLISVSTINYPFRNQGTPDLVWKTNPYVLDVVPMNQVTHHAELGAKMNKLLLKYGNNIMAHEAFFGFEPRNKYPRIYFNPGYSLSLQNKVLIDPAGITMPFSKEAFEPFVQWHLDNDYFLKSDMILIESGHANYDKDIFPDVPRIQTDNIFEYAKAINSCKLFMTNESGGAALASAIKGGNPYPNISAVMSTFTHNRGMWVWDNIRYWYTGKITGDF